MINLLPNDLKEHYMYSRRNSALRRWTFALLFALVGVGLVTTSGLLYLQHSIDNYGQKVSVAEKNLKDQKLDDTRKKSEDISGSLKLVDQVLSREVMFSQLLTRIAAVTPPNTKLTDLSISNTQGALDIAATSADYASATQLQVNLSDPDNKIFSKADIQNISCTTTAANPAYPCTITIKALFAKDNPFLFINKSGTKAKQ